MSPSGDAGKRAQAERFARYCQLRDDGMLPVEAAREVGLAISASSTGGAYERSYREARGLPRRRPGYGDPSGRRWPERQQGES